MRSLLLVMLLFSAQVVWADPERYQVFEEKHLSFGRTVWLQNCEACHGWGVADAPIPMEPEQWRARLEQPRETLYQHALEGFFGPDDSMMPARGGNMELTDEQVKAAVDYMMKLARHHIILSSKN